MRGLRASIKDIRSTGLKGKSAKGNYIALLQDERALGKLFNRYCPNNPLTRKLLEH